MLLNYQGQKYRIVQSELSSDGSGNALVRRSGRGHKRLCAASFEKRQLTYLSRNAYRQPWQLSKQQEAKGRSEPDHDKSRAFDWIARKKQSIRNKRKAARQDQGGSYFIYLSHRMLPKDKGVRDALLTLLENGWDEIEVVSAKKTKKGIAVQERR